MFLFFIPSYLFSQTWKDLDSIGNEYYAKGKYEYAINSYNKAIKIVENDYGINSSEYSIILNDMAESYTELGLYDKAEPIYKEALKLRKEIHGDRNPFYATSLDNLAALYCYMGRFIEAEPLLNEALVIRKEVLGENHQDFAMSLNNLALLYDDMGQYDKAEKYYIDASIIWKETLGEKDRNYAWSLNNLALLYNTIGKYHEADTIFKEVIKIFKEAIGEDHPDYASAINCLGMLYSSMGKYNESEVLLKRAQEIRKNAFGENHPDYAISLYNLAELYKIEGKYYKSELLYKEAIVIRKKIRQGRSLDYAESLNSLAELYDDMGQYEKAEPLYIEALIIRKEILGEKHSDYAQSLNNLALLYFNIGEDEKAEQIFKEALKIRKEILGEKHIDYAESLINLALLYQNIGQFVKAEQYYVDAINIDKEILGNKHSGYAIDLNILASLYVDMHYYEKAEPLYKEAINIYKDVFGEGHPDYAETLNNLAELYRKTGQYKKAESFFIKALKIQKEVLGDKNPEYATTLDNLASLYHNIGQNEKAESLFIKVLNIRKEVFGEKHSDFANSLSKLADYYYDIKDYENSGKYYKNLINNLRNQILTKFSYMNENEKSKFLKIISPDFDAFYSFVLNDFSYDSSIVIDAINLDILTKGIILSSSSKIKQKVNDLISIYDQLSSIKKTLAYAYTLSIEEQIQKGLSIDSLETGFEELEKELIKKSEMHSDEKKVTEWNEIRKNLKDNESIVDFINFQYYNNRWTDTIYYCAIIYRNDFRYPKFIKLFRLEQIKEILSNNKTNDINIQNPDKNLKLYKLIWEPIEQYLKGITNIYISQSGILNKISFSALRSADNKLLLDKYDETYIGNIKEIIQYDWKSSVNLSSTKNAAIFGGAIYDLDSNEIIANKEKYKSKENLKYNFTPENFTNNSFDENIRGNNWVYLKGTLTESNIISELFLKHKINVTQYVGKDASEDAFKYLNSKNSPTILHLSTHGFFYPESDKVIGKEIKTSQIFKKAKNPMLRSGLILSGANRVWLGENPIEGTEDGILTAFEVSNMDLQNTELVVLSACETGLGDIKGGEGVYGLQRAFKVAGAKTIIMSLWKVPDKETVELMELFYTNWLNGMTKHESFVNAQKVMRQKYNPYYWAAFVMVE